MPQLILIELIYHVVLWLNAFPSKSGISEMLSPCEIVLRHRLDFKKHCQAPFGSYCEAHDEPAPTNNMMSRSTPSIVLGPMGNLQGTYKFFSLTTGKKIKRRRLTRYPMPDSVIRKVERYARAGATPNELDFADRSGILFEWNEEIDESLGELVEEDYVPYPSIPAEFPGVDLERDTPMETIEEEFVPHGRPEDAAALNAGYVPPDLAGVERAAVIDAHADEIAHDELDEDDGVEYYLNGTKKSTSPRGSSSRRITYGTPPSLPSSQEWTSNATHRWKRSRKNSCPTAAPKTRPPSTPATYRPTGGNRCTHR
jgi:hypothetical protein